MEKEIKISSNEIEEKILKKIKWIGDRCYHYFALLFVVVIGLSILAILFYVYVSRK